MNPRSQGTIWSCDQLQFGWPGQPQLLRIAGFSLSAGERILLEGPSGCGKSTLLNLAAGVLLPHRGSICLLGEELVSLRAVTRDRLRSDHIGLVFQQFNLLPYLDVRSNVLLGCRFSARRRRGLSAAALAAEADRLLAAFHLAPGAYARRPVRELSVGQQQRVAAARALIGGPELVIADEPTSALDPATRDLWLSQFLNEARTAGSAVMLVSHDPALRAHVDRVVSLASLQEEASC